VATLSVVLGLDHCSFISSHGDFPSESLELLCTTALDVLLVSRDDRFAQVRTSRQLVSQDPAPASGWLSGRGR
jgi:hypothetical protein